MYVVEYHRFFLRDLELIMIWPSRGWLSRIIVPALLSGALGAFLWLWANSTAGAIFIGIGLGWVLLELLLGPTAKSRVQYIRRGDAVHLPRHRSRQGAGPEGRSIGDLPGAASIARWLLRQRHEPVRPDVAGAGAGGGR